MITINKIITFYKDLNINLGMWSAKNNKNMYGWAAKSVSLTTA